MREQPSQGGGRERQGALPFEGPLGDIEQKGGAEPPPASGGASGAADLSAAELPSASTGDGQEGASRRRNAYEEKLERRRERLEEAARKAEGRSAEAYEASRRAVEHIPLGQPIIRGHHSERGHRADIKRSHRAMDRCVEEAGKAKELARRAERVGTAGVSADDPEAQVKLARQLEQLETRREMMKRVNREFRKGGWEVVTGISDEARAKFQADMARMPWQGESPFPPYALKNLGANIRRIQKRLEDLARLEFEGEMEDLTCEHGTYRMSYDADSNRVRFYFPGKPAADVRALLKREGFRWAPSVEAWQRQLSANGMAAGDRVRAALDEMAEAS